jgi:PAS domain-containing protein
MLRFIEEQNIAYLERLLATEAISDTSRYLVEEQLLTAQRRLDALAAVKSGLKSRSQTARERAQPRATPRITSWFRDRFEAADTPLMLLDPSPGLHIVHTNRAYARATMTDASKVAGEKLFNVFPDNPGDPFADGAANVFDSLRIVAETGRPHTMAVQRYDIRNTAGVFEERYWRPVNSPVLDENGDLVFILNRVLDVTAKIPRRAPWRQPKMASVVTA